MPQAAAPEPQRFGKYQILERIAAGGMAEIFKARLDGIGGFHRTFAIKRILPHLTANPEFVDMLVDEAKVAGLLSHANIVQILDLGNVDQQFYIAMEYVNGRDLGQLLARCAEKGITLPVPHAVYVLLEMLKGLEYAHQRQVMRGGRPVPLHIVHRDISPANILLSFQGEVKLTDFGIAKASVKALETMSGVVKGRFDYMSPEQASGGAVDQRSDLFSAGVVLYQLLTGRHPFRQPSELATIEAIRRGQFEPPSYANPDVPYSLDLVVEQALKVNPAERFQTATAFKEALDRFFHDAGFIFSASTLAAFIKGLFPEADPRPQPPANATLPPPPAPVEADDVSLEDDSGGNSRATRPLPTPRPGVAALPPGDSTVGEAAALLRALPHQESGAFGPIAGLGDESTLIRPAPAPASQWNDVETVIRSDPGKATAARPAPLPPRPKPEAVPAPLPPKATRAAPPSAPARPLRPPPPVPQTPAHVHLLYGLAVFAMLVFGFAVGLVVGSASESGGGDPVVVKLDPVLEIHYPTGAAVTVDGRALTGPSPLTTTLPAGRTAVVRVSGAGYAATEARVTLDYNQMRVLTFDSMSRKEP